MARETATDPAFDLIVALLRCGSPPTTGADEHPVTVAAFRAALARHGVALSLPPAMRLKGVLPEALQEVLAAVQRHQTLASLVRVSALAKVSATLIAADIPFCAIKGPAFAALFGNPLMREACDLDLLIRPMHFDAALDCLGRLGYRPDQAAGVDLRRYLIHEHALSLHHTGHWPMIELHVRLSYDDRQFPLALFDPWSHLTTVEIATVAVPTLMPVVALVYAAFHGTKHGWNRLLWLDDIRQALGDSQLDWSAVLDFARQMAAERQVILAVLLAVEVLGAPMPPALTREEALIQRVRPLVRALRPHLDQTTNRRADLALFMGLGPYLGWLFALHRSWRARLSLISFFQAVSAQDRAFLSLPPWLDWAYPLVRSVRLVTRYLTKSRS